MLECRHIFQRVLPRWFSTLGVAIVAIAPLSIIRWYGGYYGYPRSGTGLTGLEV